MQWGQLAHPLTGRAFAKQMAREGTFCEHQTIARDPDRASHRAKRDTDLRPELWSVWQDNRSIYGVRKL